MCVCFLLVTHLSLQPTAVSIVTRAVTEKNPDWNLPWRIFSSTHELPLLFLTFLKLIYWNCLRHLRAVLPLPFQARGHKSGIISGQGLPSQSAFNRGCSPWGIAIKTYHTHSGAHSFNSTSKLHYFCQPQQWFYQCKRVQCIVVLCNPPPHSKINERVRGSNQGRASPS